MMSEDNAFREEAYTVLKQSTLFGKLDPELLQSMIAECTEVQWKKAETLDHDIGMKHLYIIISGRLKITHIDPESGRSLALFLKSSGDLFDVFSLLDGKEHVVFPVVMDNMTVLRIPIERAREWILEYTQFNESFLPYLGKKMRELEAFGTSLVFHDTTTRLANLILKHTDASKENSYDHYPVTLINNLSHESLAEMIGSVRSVVSTQMHKLKDEGVIASKRGHLAVKNFEKLVKKCDRYFYA